MRWGGAEKAQPLIHGRTGGANESSSVAQCQWVHIYVAMPWNIGYCHTAMQWRRRVGRPLGLRGRPSASATLCGGGGFISLRQLENLFARRAGGNMELGVRQAPVLQHLRLFLARASSKVLNSRRAPRSGLHLQDLQVAFLRAASQRIKAGLKF